MTTIKEKHCRRFDKNKIQRNYMKHKQIHTKNKLITAKFTFHTTFDDKISHIQNHTMHFITPNKSKAVINMRPISTILVMSFWWFLRCKKVTTKICYEYKDKLDHKKTKQFQQNHFLILMDY